MPGWKCTWSSPTVWATKRPAAWAEIAAFWRARRRFPQLSLGSAAVALVLAASAEPLFAPAFGERWRLAGTMALWLLPLFALSFVASPLSYLFYVAGKPHVDLVWQGLQLAMSLAALWVPAHARGALLAYSAG